MSIPLSRRHQQGSVALLILLLLSASIGLGAAH
jgi:hypothetical protein